MSFSHYKHMESIPDDPGKWKVGSISPGRAVSLAESPVHGKDVFAFAPHGQGAKDYNALAEELIGIGFFEPPK